MAIIITDTVTDKITELGKILLIKGLSEKIDREKSSKKKEQMEPDRVESSTLNTSSTMTHPIASTASSPMVFSSHIAQKNYHDQLSVPNDQSSFPKMVDPSPKFKAITEALPL